MRITPKLRKNPLAIVVVLLCVVALVTCWAFTSCAITSGSTFESLLAAEAEQESDSPDGGEPDPIPEEPDTPKLRITTNPRGADVWIDGDYVGTSPVDIEEIKGGTYRLVLELDGYYEDRRWIDVPSDSAIEFNIDLDPITGFLAVETMQGAEILVDGFGVDESFLELPIGSYQVAVRRFGYVEQSFRVIVEEARVTTIDVELTKAPFSLTGVGVSRSAFNPANPGATGEIAIHFSVSAPGSGEISIVAPDGTTIQTIPIGPFADWSQRYVWNGTDSSGRALPDGTYTLLVDARGIDGRLGSGVRLVGIDSSLIITYRSIWNSAPGLLYTHTLDPLPAGQLQLSAQVAGIFTTVDSSLVTRFPSRLGIRVGMGGGTELFAFGGLVANSSPLLDRWSAGAALVWRAIVIPLAPPTADLSLGITAGGVYRTPDTDGRYAGPDTQTDFPGLSFSVPVVATIEPFFVSVAPEVKISPAPVFYGGGATPDNAWTTFGYLRVGAGADIGGLTIGASAAFRTAPLVYGFALDLPFAGGAELHWVLPGTSIGISGFVAGEFEDPANYYIMSGASVGFLF